MGYEFLRDEANSGSLRFANGLRTMCWCGVALGGDEAKGWLCPIPRPRPRVLIGRSDCIRDSLGPLKLRRFSGGALLKLTPFSAGDRRSCGGRSEEHTSEFA